MSDMEELAASTVELAMRLPIAVVYLNVAIANNNIPEALKHLALIRKIVEQLRPALQMFQAQNALQQ
jgi:hypothetical protein